MRSGLLLSLLLASAAFAAPKKPTVVLSGPPAVTKWVSKELSKKYAPSNAKGAVSGMPTAKEVRDVTAPVGAVALVLCQASDQFITLQVLSGHDGTPLDTVSLKASVKKLPKVMPKPQLAALLFALANGKAPGKDTSAPPPPAEKDEPKKEEPPPPVKKDEPVVEKKKRNEEPPPPPVKKEEPKTVVEEKPSEPMTPSTQPAVRVSFGVGGQNRNFSWAGNPSPILGTSTQPFNGGLSVDASWFPGAHVTSNFLSNLGVFVSGDFGLRVVSTQDGVYRFAHQTNRLRFGGIIRLPLGERFTPYVHAGYSRHEMTTSSTAVNDPLKPRPVLPDVLFNGFRAGLGFRLRMFGTVELDALGGFQTVAGMGELKNATFFPQASAFAVDAGGGLSVQVLEHVRLRAGAEWQRYFVTLNAAEDSLYFAKTASDQYVTVNVGLSWVM